MTSKSRQRADVSGHPRPFCGPACQCVADFFREEFLKHHHCLELQREYYSEVAIMQAEEALARIMGRLDELCAREDAGQMMGELLRQFDTITNLSAWTERSRLH